LVAVLRGKKEINIMGVRAGQGYGVAKPKRRACPECSKHGVTQWRPTGAGLERHCQFCQASWGEAGWKLALGVADHITHPFKVEAWSRFMVRSILIGRQMFKTMDEAKSYAAGAAEDETDLPVSHSRPGDTEFT
jgi:hypothetical protein